MTGEAQSRALLPTGLSDLMAPEADQEAALVEALLGDMTLFGYERVKPPLLEFEDSLLAGMGSAVAQQTFRVMDPLSQRMMGLRADMTLQVARIAASRLDHRARPLRVSYAGDVCRIRGSQLRPTRQFTQVGAELIGAAEPAADAEVISMAASVLIACGVEDLTVDLNIPTLVPALVEAYGLDARQHDELRAALDRKDPAAVASAGGPAAATCQALLGATGRAGEVLDDLAHLELPAAAAAERDHLAEVVAILGRDHGDLPLTIDPVEYRGFEYQAGVSFSIFAPGVRGVLGRGGRYTAHRDDGGEDATGVTLYMDTVRAALGPATRPKRVYAPYDVPASFVDQLRYDGAVVVSGLAPEGDIRAAARAQECSLILRQGWVEAVDEDES